MEDFIFAPLVLAVGFGIHAAILRRHSPAEGKLLTSAFAMHVGAGIAQVLLTKYYFGGGDMMLYFETGVPMAEALRSDLGLFGPALVQGFFRSDDITAPIEFMPGGGSTQSMSAIAIWLLFLLGNSLYATVLLLSIGSYASKVLLYRAMRDDFATPVQRYVLIGVTLLPTAAFWSCGLLKEPVVMSVIGPTVLGLRWLSAGHRRPLAIVAIGVSATVMAVIKPYVLMTLSIAAAVFYLLSRFRTNDSAAMKPFAIVTAAALGLGGFVLGNRYFVKQENDSTAASFARQRQVGYGVEGGSNYQLDGPADLENPADRSLVREFALVPLALFTALFRPAIIEARNAVQLANAIEATVLLVLFVQIVRRKGLAGMVGAVRASPTLTFCAVFTLALALGTGLSSTNLGTLSRYRAPMMPFFFTLLLVLRFGEEAVRRAAQLTSVGEVRSPGRGPLPVAAVPAPRA